MSRRLVGAACVAALCIALAIPLVASAGTVVTAQLTANQIVNPAGGDPNGTGKVRLNVNRVKQRICYRVKYSGLDMVTGSHLHKGAKGAIGREIVTLFQGNRPSPVEGCVRNVRKKIIKRLKRKPAKHYVDIDSRDYPNGALRGQLGRR